MERKEKNAGQARLWQMQIRMRKGLVGCGEEFTVAMSSDGRPVYVGADRWGQGGCISWRDMAGVFCGPDYVLGLGKDGAVLGAGRNTHGRLDVSGWAGVRLLACGPNHAAALTGSGRVMCTGDPQLPHSKVGEWVDVVDICCGADCTVGVHRDGHVLVAGGSRHLKNRLRKWHDVAGVFADLTGECIYGITHSGTLLCSQGMPSSMGGWQRLVAVMDDGRTRWGITVTGEMLCDHTRDLPVALQGADNVVAGAAGMGHSVLLRKNGRFYGWGRNQYVQCGVSHWAPPFDDFDTYAARWADRTLATEQLERKYQRCLTEAVRFGRRLACGDRMTASLSAEGKVNVTAPLQGVKRWEGVCAIGCGGGHLLALHRDGRVSADGTDVHGCCAVDGWRHVKSIYAGQYHSLGLTEDGNVYFTGWNRHGQGDVGGWTGIRLLRGSEFYTVGIDYEGKLYVAGQTLPFDADALRGMSWRDVVDVSLSKHHLAALRGDGTVFFAGDEMCGDAEEIRKTVSGWQGVRSIASGHGFVVGLCYGGQVVAAGRNHLGQCNTEAWRQAVAVGCGRGYTAALLMDGTLVTAGMMRCHETASDWYEALDDRERSLRNTWAYDKAHTETWKELLAMACGEQHVVAVDRHGHVFATGLDRDGQCSVAAGFSLFKELRHMDGHGQYKS